MDGLPLGGHSSVAGPLLNAYRPTFPAGAHLKVYRDQRLAPKLLYSFSERNEAIRSPATTEEEDDPDGALHSSKQKW